MKYLFHKPGILIKAIGAILKTAFLIIMYMLETLSVIALILWHFNFKLQWLDLYRYPKGIFGVYPSIGDYYRSIGGDDAYDSDHWEDIPPGDVPRKIVARESIWRPKFKKYIKRTVVHKEFDQDDDCGIGFPI